MNEGEEEINTTVTVRNIGEIEKWNAFDGSIERQNIIKKIEMDSMDISLYMHRREAVIFCITPSREVTKNNEDEQNIIRTFPLDKNWYQGKENKFIEIKEFKLWNETEEYKYYSGPMLYKLDFEIKEVLENIQVQLDLGSLHEIVKVTLNQKEAGVKMWGPYIFDVTDYLIKGKNELKLEITNSLANKVCNISLPSGLIGPVTLEFLSNN